MAGRPDERGDVILLLSGLTAVAGCLDALSFLALGGVFTANMTGTVVLLAVATARGDTATLLRLTVALASFLLGALAGTRLARDTVEAPRRRDPWRRHVNLAIAIELLIVLSWSVVWTIAGGQPGNAGTYVLIFGAALAMGMQSSAAVRVGVGGVSTAYITGTLTALAGQLTGGPANLRGAAARAWIIVAYFGGALAGAALRSAWPRGVGWLPALGLAAVATAGWIRRRGSAMASA